MSAKEQIRTYKIRSVYRKLAIILFQFNINIFPCIFAVTDELSGSSLCYIITNAYLICSFVNISYCAAIYRSLYCKLNIIPNIYVSAEFF